MSRPIKVVVVSGSVQRPSRTLVLAESLLAELAEALPLDSRLIEIRELARHLPAALERKQAPAPLESAIREIETAELLVVATPVYRASYTGLLKHLFDLVHHESLIDTPVLLAATGGSDRHALVIDHQLRPLFSFFQSRVAPLGVYASESDFDGYELRSEQLRDRIALAVSAAVPLLSAPRRTGAAVAVAA